MAEYDNAAEALGVDELNIASINATEAAAALTAINDAIADTANGGNGLTLMITAPDVTPIDIGDAMNPNTDVDGKGIAAWNEAQQVFATEQGIYDAAVLKAKVATDAYDASAKAYDEAMVQERITQVKLDHAGVSLTAATEMDNASTSKPLHFQVGANGGQSLFMSIGSLKSDTLGIGDGKGNTYINVVKDTGADITATIDVLDQALSYVTTERSRLGAAVNRMEYTQASLDITSENLTDAEARIRDADMAQEMMNKTKADTLQQVAVAMMSQANQQPQSILQLLR
jgi:flagellin